MAYNIAFVLRVTELSSQIPAWYDFYLCGIYILFSKMKYIDTQQKS
jgi:hypothetical protein